MKNVKKCVGLVSSLLLLGSIVLTGCNNNGGKSDPNSFNLSTLKLEFTEDTSNLSVDIGESKTITINAETTVGTWKLDEESIPDSIEVEEVIVNNKLTGLTITGVEEAASALFTVIPEEAGDKTDYDVTISVTVVDPKYTFEITLTDELAAKANTVTVKYSNDDGDKNWFDAEVEYTAGAKKATVKVLKKNADDWGYLNAITVTVKDAEGNVITTEKIGDENNWFKITDTYNGFTVGIKTSASMTLKINFTDFTADSAKLTYGYDDLNEEVVGVIADDKASATFTISNSFIKASGWPKIISLVVVSEAKTLEVVTNDNLWFAYTENGTQIYTYSKKAEMTELYSEAIGDVPASEFEGITAERILIEAVDCNWSAVSGSWYIKCAQAADESNDQVGKLVWVDNTYYKLEITDADVITKILSEGITLWYSEGLTATIKVSYK